MIATPTGRSRCVTLAVLFAVPLWFACGSDDTGPEDETGATLLGTVTMFEAQVVGGGFALAATEGVTVAIGSKSTETDANGDFVLDNIPLGNLQVQFSKDQLLGLYSLFDVESGETFMLDEVQYSNGQISTKHTGTWVGTGGSSDPSSAGQIALTMILQANGNSLTGTASVVPPDASVWDVEGSETGQTVSGEFKLVTSNSECASDGEFDGVFDADTLRGTFVEVHTADQDALCGPVENGTFRVVKQ